MTGHHLTADHNVDNSAAAQDLVDHLIAAFAPKDVQRLRCLRGSAFVPRGSHDGP